MYWRPPMAPKNQMCESEVQSSPRRAGPFIKWAGGKTQLLPYLRELIPKNLGTYYEPFIGGGALFFALADEGRFTRAILNDWNKDLVETYRVVRDFPEDLMTFLRERECEYELSPKDTFLRWRAPDKELRETVGPVERAGRFILLNKAGFNGLYRVNKYGQFNVPWGKRPVVRTFDEGNIRACSEVLERYATLRQGDFSDACLDAQPGDTVCGTRSALLWPFDSWSRGV